MTKSNLFILLSLTLGFVACDTDTSSRKGPIGSAGAPGYTFEGKKVSALSDFQKKLMLNDLGSMMLVSIEISSLAGIDSVGPVGSRDVGRGVLLQRLMRRFNAETPTLDRSDCAQNRFSRYSIPMTGARESRSGSVTKEIYVAGTSCALTSTGQFTANATTSRSATTRDYSNSHSFKFDFSMRIFPNTRLSEATRIRSLTTNATLTESDSLNGGRLSQVRGYSETTMMMDADKNSIRFLTGIEGNMNGPDSIQTSTGSDILVMQLNHSGRILLIQAFSELKGYNTKTTVYINGELIDFDPPKPTPAPTPKPTPVALPPAKAPEAKPIEQPKPQSLFEQISLMTKASPSVTFKCSGESVRTSGGKNALGTDLTVNFKGSAESKISISALATDSTNSAASSKYFRVVENWKPDTMAIIDFHEGLYMYTGDFSASSDSVHPMGFGDGHGLTFVDTRRGELSVGVQIQRDDFLKAPKGPWPARIWIKVSGSVYLPYNGQFGKTDARCYLAN